MTFLGLGTLTTETCFAALCEKGFAPTAALWMVIGLSFGACVVIDLLRRAGLWVVRFGFSRVEHNAYRNLGIYKEIK